MPSMMTASAFGRMLNLSTRGAIDLILAGRIRAERVGHAWIIDRAEAEAFAATYVKGERATTRARRAASTDTTTTEAQDGAL